MSYILSSMLIFLILLMDAYFFVIKMSEGMPSQSFS